MKRKIRKRLTEEQQATILANYQKYTLCEIAEKMNVQYHQVNRFAKKIIYHSKDVESMEVLKNLLNQKKKLLNCFAKAGVIKK